MTDVKQRLEAGEHISIADISAADREALGIPTSFEMSKITSDPFMEFTPWTAEDIKKLDAVLAETFQWREDRKTDRKTDPNLPRPINNIRPNAE